MAIRLHMKLITAPTRTLNVNKFCLLVGTKYWMPVTLLMAMTTITKDNVLSTGITLSKPAPKNHGTKFDEVPIMPKQKGIPRKQTNL